MGGNALRSCCGRNHMQSMYETSDMPIMRKKSKLMATFEGDKPVAATESNVETTGYENTYQNDQQYNQPYVDMDEVIRNK